MAGSGVGGAVRAHPCLSEPRRPLSEVAFAVLAGHRRVRLDVPINLAQLGLEHDGARLERVQNVQQVLTLRAAGGRVSGPAGPRGVWSRVSPSTLALKKWSNHHPANMPDACFAAVAP